MIRHDKDLCCYVSIRKMLPSLYGLQKVSEFRLRAGRWHEVELKHLSWQSCLLASLLTANGLSACHKLDSLES